MFVSLRHDGASVAARLVVSGVFIGFGTTKLVDVDQTIRSVRAYRLLPEALVPTVGTALPLLEVLVGLLVLLGLLTRATASVAGLLSLAFVVGIVSAWARGLSIECGCFGTGGFTPDPVPGYLRELAINAVLVAACLRLLTRPPGRLSLDHLLGLTRPPPHTPEYGEPS